MWHFTAVTAVTLNRETIIFEVNEVVHVQENPISLPSTFQDRENGVRVIDVAKRHGGTQNMVADGYDLPLIVRNSLTYARR